MLDNFLRKYFIMGSQNCARDPVIVLEEALQAGITAFQYREKGDRALQGKAKLMLATKLRELCRKYKVPFIINDDVELISLLEADGVHVGQDDRKVTELRIQYPDLLIGLSISNEIEMQQSPIHLVDYIGAGPIYQTTTKQDAKPPVGLNWISALREKHPYLPIVGIGGIHQMNAKDVLEAGANGVAVISAISHAKDIKQTVEHL